MLITFGMALLSVGSFDCVQKRFDEWRAIDNLQLLAAEPSELARNLVAHEYNSCHVHQDDFFLGFSMARAGRFQFSVRHRVNCAIQAKPDNVPVLGIFSNSQHFRCTPGIWQDMEQCLRQ
jgi:hypothetical protein